jgi:uncharacterized protein YkwD
MPRTLGQAVGFLLGVWLVIALSPLWVETAAADDSPRFAARLHAEVNRVRADQHLVTLVRRHDLDAVALAHSEDMARRGYFSHDSPEGANPVHRLNAGRISDMRLAGENLGMTTEASPSLEIVTQWLASPDHRSNLLAPAFNFTGIGVARNARGALIYTQVYISAPRESLPGTGSVRAE